jgi:hypothetical protein
LEFGACGIKPLTQYGLDDELVNVYWNPLCGKRPPPVLVVWAADNMPIVTVVFNRAEGWKRIVGLEHTRGQYKRGNGESPSAHLPACCLDHFFKQREVEFGVPADIERMTLEEGPPRHFCTPNGFIDVAANRFLELQILCEQVVFGRWR